MKTRLFLIVGLSLLISSSLLAQPGPGNGRGMRGNGQCLASVGTSATSQSLTGQEAKWLSLMREEEKLARDVYTALYDVWKLSIFSNISRSEQRHFDAIKILLDRYKLDDPASGKGAGEFSNPDLQNLYDTLVNQGRASLTAALQVGVAIETQDIKDLKDAIAGTTKPDILRVYTNLLAGSVNHLEAFQSHLEVQGVKP